MSNTWSLCNFTQQAISSVVLIRFPACNHIRAFRQVHHGLAFENEELIKYMFKNFSRNYIWLTLAKALKKKSHFSFIMSGIKIQYWKTKTTLSRAVVEALSLLLTLLLLHTDFCLQRKWQSCWQILGTKVLMQPSGAWALRPARSC